MQQLYQGDLYTHLANAFSHNNIKKVFCVAGSTSFEKTGAKSVLDKTEIDYVVYSDFSPNPKYEDMIGGIQSLNEYGADIVLVIGGGSAMDIAKLIVGFAGINSSQYDQYMMGQESIKDSKCPLWAVPTTSGSGAEATHFAVVYYGDKKYSVASQSIIPNTVFLDSTLTHTTPKNIATATGIDALCQGIESYWAVGGTDESRKFATDSIEIVLNNFKPAMAGDKDSLKELQYGAYLAGCAINISKTTAGHAFSYHLTQKYDVIHGNAVAIMLSAVFEYSLNYGNDNDKQKCSEISAILNINPDELPTYLLSMLGEMGLVNTLAETGVDNIEKIDVLCETVNVERLGNNPVKIDMDKFKNMLGQKI